jgi:Transposase DDE domain group 1
MRLSKSAVTRKSFALPELRFEDQALTSFSGLVLFQALIGRLDLREHLRTCFAHLKLSPVAGYPAIFLSLVCHLLLGFRFLRDLRYYRDDPMVQRFLGLQRLPDVATVSRAVAEADPRAVDKLRRLLRRLLLDRLRCLRPARLTLDFDGSVLSTRRAAEGSAVGFNKKRKGERSYYPLFCTIAQTGQVFDFFHRSGNVHDSNGARDFILACIAELRQALPGVIVEARLDSAFFSDDIVRALDLAGVEFSISVPFERFAELKKMIEGRRGWQHFSDDLSFFDTAWKPKSWDERFRFVFVRQLVTERQRGPLQLDLFIPTELGYDFKVIVTNKRIGVRHVLAFHNGRGSQEGIFAELKTHAHMDYVPFRRRVANQLWLLAGLFAHNLTRELQMFGSAPVRGTTESRSAFWPFHGLQTIRRSLLQRAGRFTRPNGQLTLTLAANPDVANEMRTFLRALQQAA